MKRVQGVSGLVLTAAIAFASLAPLPARGQDAVPAGAPTLATIVQKLAEDPQTPNAYSAQVNLHVKLRIFPFISLTLRGNSTYRRPGLYRFVFRGVPKAAERFADLAYDLGNPAVWPARYEIALLGAPAPGGDAVIRMIPKKRGLVRFLDVTVDTAKGHIASASWSRYDGGTIVLRQYFSPVGNRELVARQEAKIELPHMKADLVADYSDFSFEVAER